MIGILKKKKGIALTLVLIFTLVGATIGAYFLKSMISGGIQTKVKSNTLVAQYLAEAALEKTVYNIAKQINDFPVDNIKQLKDITHHKWFWYMRLPGVMAKGGLTAGFGANQGIGVSMNFQTSNLTPKVTYTAQDLGLQDLIKDVTGKSGAANVTVTANIDRSYGISSGKPDLVIPGISTPDIPVADGITKWISSKKLPSFEMPSMEFGLKDLVSNLKVTMVIEGVPVPFPIGKIIETLLPSTFTNIDFKKIMSDVGIPTKISLGNIACNIVTDILPGKITIPDLKQTKAEVQMEKYGYLRFKVNSEYTPNISAPDTKYKYKIDATKEFKVVDLQPVAPRHSFFIANSSDSKINFNTGKPFTVNSFDWFKLGISSADPIKLADTINFPGLIRVNGSQEMPVKTNFIGEFKGWKFITQTEWPLLFIPGNSDDYDNGALGAFSNKTGFIPSIPTLPEGAGKWGKWQWPAFGTKNSLYTMPWPDSEATTHLFGDFCLKFPYNLEIEGNVTKKFRYWYAAIIQIIIPWPVSITFPIPMWRTTWSDSKPEKLKQYTFRWDELAKNAPFNLAFKDFSDIKDRVRDPNAPKNKPTNLYAMDQYAKKATHFYNSSAEFNDEIKKRIKMSGDNTFVLDGVNFINSSVELPSMIVKGKGMIVSAGNIIVNGDIKQLGGMGGTNVDAIRFTKFSLIAPAGKVIVKKKARIDAAIYAKQGIATEAETVINGNLVVDSFNKSEIGADTTVNYVASKTRMSVPALIPKYGKYAPLRYFASLSEQWLSYNAKDITTK
jgi:hypothetical protein